MIKFLKYISLSLLFWIFFDSVQAQNQKKIDSLLNVLKIAHEDTNKANILNSLSKQLRNTSDFEKAKKYADDALQLSQQINYKKGKSEAYNSSGLINWTQGNFPEATKNFMNALQIAEETGYKKGVAVIYGNLGLIQWNQGNHSEALKYFFLGLKIDEELKNKEDIAIDYNNIGNIYGEQGNYDEALKNYRASLKILLELDNKQVIANTNINMGNIYVYQNKYAEARKLFFDALETYEKLGDKDGLAMTHNNIGEVYLDLGNYSEALERFSTGLKLALEIGDKRLVSASYLNIGRADYGLKNFSGAREFLNKGLSVSREIGMKDFIKTGYQLLAQLDSAVGNYPKSLEHFKLYSIYKDSVFNETSSKQTAEMKTKYESEKKDKEILVLTKDSEIQNLEIKKQKQLKIIFISGFALVLILSFFVYNNFRIRNKLKLQNIRNRIASDLHDDVGSTLNSISVYSEVAKQKSPAVMHELEQIGDASRKIIEVMSDIVWTINPKNDTFESIILRMSTLSYNLLKAKEIEHTFRADESLNGTKLSLESRRNFYLIFKEALNNLVKYSNATRASIELTNERGLIKLAVRDNGAGFDIAQTSKGNGILNMKTRAEEMNAKLKIESEKGGGTNLELILKA